MSPAVPDDPILPPTLKDEPMTDYDPDPRPSTEPAGDPVEEAVAHAIEDAYLNTTDRFDAFNEFRAAARAAIEALQRAGLLPSPPDDLGEALADARERNDGRPSTLEEDLRDAPHLRGLVPPGTKKPAGADRPPVETDGQGVRSSQPAPEPSTAEAALRAICGPTDAGVWAEVYRAAGGGYEGLQAIALAALSSPTGQDTERFIGHEEDARVMEASPRGAAPQGADVCGRLLVGSGDDTYDPVCELPEGHAGSCKSSSALDQHRLPEPESAAPVGPKGPPKQDQS